MRRSISKIALALVVVLVVGFLAVSCSAGPKEHVHTLGTEHEAVKGTCQAKGELAYWDCKGCDAKLNEQGEVLESIEGEVDLNNHAGVGVWTAKGAEGCRQIFTCCSVEGRLYAHVYVGESTECSYCDYQQPL